MKKMIVGLMIVAMTALSLSADIYIKSRTHTDAMQMMGNTSPAKDADSELWIGDNAMATTILDRLMHRFNNIASLLQNK